MTKKAIKINNKQQTINKLQTSDKLTAPSFFAIAFACILFLTSAVYLQSLNNDFVNWDDEQYVYKNTSITTLHGDSIVYTLQKIFTTYVVGNYHPLTMLSYCMEYNLYGLNPKAYHTTNLSIHLLNSLLVFVFIYLLNKQRFTALIVALLFAIHPMHVESVAWISERKDVLYSFFYLASLCTYVLYVQSANRKKALYILTLALFILALLSKAMGVSIPIMFMAIDYYRGTNINIRTQKNKIPFLILSLITGIVAIKAQLAFDAIGSATAYPFYERILFACYGIIHYLHKLFLPIGLSCFYPYPLKESQFYPAIYYIAPFMVLAITLIVFRFFRTHKEVIFGFLFFFITIALVLQVLPVGEAIVADRYTYLPYIGLFFIMASAAEKHMQQSPKYKLPYYIVFAAGIALFSIMAHKRSMVWKNGFTLWENALKNAQPAYISFYCMGNAYATRNQHEKAIENFHKAAEIRRNDYNLFYSRGYSYYFVQEYELAIRDFDTTLALNPEVFDAYLTRGGAYYQIKYYEKAIADYDIVLTLNPNHAPTYCNRAITHLYLGRYADARNDAQKAESLGFDVPEQLFRDIDRGLRITQQKN